MDQKIWKRLGPLTRSITPNEMVVSEKECWAILGRKKSKTVKALSPVYKTKQKLWCIHICHHADSEASHLRNSFWRWRMLWNAPKCVETPPVSRWVLSFFLWIWWACDCFGQWSLAEVTRVASGVRSWKAMQLLPSFPELLTLHKFLHRGLPLGTQLPRWEEPGWEEATYSSMYGSPSWAQPWSHHSPVPDVGMKKSRNDFSSQPFKTVQPSQFFQLRPQTSQSKTSNICCVLSADMTHRTWEYSKMVYVFQCHQVWGYLLYNSK